MIKEDYVSFETAKLLKEKGFDSPGNVWYAEYTSQFSGKKYNSLEYDDYNRFNEDYKFLFYVPTLQKTMKWLREVHNLHIAVIVTYQHIPRKYEAHIMKLEYEDDFILHQNVDFTSYEEACETAIKYCLENLI